VADELDLTARLVSLREAVERQIQSASDLATIRMNSMDSTRDQHMASLASERAALKEQIILVREIQDAYHESMQRQSELQSVANAGTVTTLANAMQLQLDQRFASAREGSVLLQSELDRRFTTVRRDMAALQLQVDQRFGAESEARRVALVTATEAIKAALTAAETAVNKAEVATEKRFEGVNEFRKTLSDQTGTFPTRDEVRAQIEVVRASAERNAESLKAMELRFQSRLDTAAGQDKGESAHQTEVREERTLQHSSVQLVIASIAGVIALISIAVTIIIATRH
jgi:hypothetical protein